MRISVLRSGSDASGLTRYLFGAGRVNEHDNPHLVAGSPGLEMEWSGELSVADATILGRVVEGAWYEKYVEALAGVGAAQGGLSRAQLHRDGVETTGRTHVFHASMALPPTHDHLTDEQWNTLAHEYVKRMGFVDDNGHGSSWIAVRHGVSSKGNDHIHVVVNLVREDGAWSSEHQSKIAADRIGRELEQEFSSFLSPTYETPGIEGTRQPGFSAYSQAELRRSEERELKGSGPIDPDRVHLQRVVRGVAMGSRTEAEWLNNLANQDLEILPRWAPGGRDKVTGYSVRFADQDSVRIAASKLAPDLTLTSLRKSLWALNETPESRAEALALWRDEAPVTDPEPVDATTELDQAGHHLKEWESEVKVTDPHDVDQWRSHAATAAGVLSLAAIHHPNREAASRLGQVADEAARVSFEPQHPQQRTYGHGSLQQRSGGAGLAMRHLNLALRGSSQSSTRGWYAVMKQMQRTMRAIHDAQVARGELVDAARTQAVSTGHLDVYSDESTAPVAVVSSQGEAGPELTAKPVQARPVVLPAGRNLGERPRRFGGAAPTERGYER
ncbi:hypothetical protein [Yimella sp. cx-51]|uniref:relaxase/mobilization nuclease domain-containing protein n=1 Tax=Yimella sp. cx-51 TaxID=2770551 RepID=UPI00165DCA8A|nr:hypothetical protein [Yimella sp. cx-51]MBC9958342.1 hypothetical protein [Yimella sp. cx-51]QTH39761.1 hypothetical protein J5M86_15215 [Yimella sp. cx-51]